MPDVNFFSVYYIMLQ